MILSHLISSSFRRRRNASVTAHVVGPDGVLVPEVPAEVQGDGDVLGTVTSTPRLDAEAMASVNAESQYGKRYATEWSSAGFQGPRLTADALRHRAYVITGMTKTAS